ncbi:MAG: hypothetical protein HDT28_01745 [Clostridiales bacterium]|nr:hypothetical protein [Clostridiales bacterium]
MLRKNQSFPLGDNPCYTFLKSAWERGLFDEYSDNHFLIRAIENRLDDFVGKDQLIANNYDSFGIVNEDGSMNSESFCLNFCINLSRKLQYLANKFGTPKIDNFIANQLAAGKINYQEDSFFEALSEIAVLSFYGLMPWDKYIYEPTLHLDSKKNPEATLIGQRICKTIKNPNEKEMTVQVNIEVKCPSFPHESHYNEKIAIPTILLSEDGRKRVKHFCEQNSIKYLDPRVLKLKDFLNSAASKFSYPTENEVNLLYINWSYRDFQSNSFLEAWSLLTNEINGILTNQNAANSIDVDPEVFKKITAVVVYTESLEGVMFNDFRYVWQTNGQGQKFRIWILDKDLREAEKNDKSNIILKITGMNPHPPLTQCLMLDYKSKTEAERVDACKLSLDLCDLIKKCAI